MTYRQLVFLRRKMGLGIHDLLRKFPQESRKILVTEISLHSTNDIERLSDQDPELFQEVLRCRASLEEDDE